MPPGPLRRQIFPRTLVRDSDPGPCVWVRGPPVAAEFVIPSGPGPGPWAHAHWAHAWALAHWARGGGKNIDFSKSLGMASRGVENVGVPRGSIFKLARASQLPYN